MNNSLPVINLNIQEHPLVLGLSYCQGFCWACPLAGSFTSKILDQKVAGNLALQVLSKQVHSAMPRKRTTERPLHLCVQDLRLHLTDQQASVGVTIRVF